MLLQAQSFEAYDVGSAEQLELEGWTVTDSEACTIVADGWHAQRALKLDGQGHIAALDLELSAETQVLCLQVAFQVGALSDVDLLRVTNRFFFFLQENGALELYDSNAGLIATTAAGAVRPNSWHYLEMKAQLGSSGRGLFILDGAIIGDLAARNFGANDPSTFDVNLYGSSGATTFSELVVMDGAGRWANDLLGRRVRIALLRATSDGPEIAWTPSSGASRWEVLADALPGAHDPASYATATVVGEEASVRFATAPVVDEIEAVTVLVTGYHDGALTSRPRARQGSATVNGPRPIEDAGASEYSSARLVLLADPADHRRWTRQRIATLRAGMVAENLEA